MSKSPRVRLIGGKWRSRWLNFPATNALRPTPDAVRETLFNWLMPYINGRTCLDLYAGSGALGFEAVSRGAKSAVLVEKNPRAAKALRTNQASIDEHGQVDITCCAALDYLATCAHRFDLIFLDPPFATDELAKACYKIEKKQLLIEDGLVYVESPSELKSLPVPENWQPLKQAQKGAVRYTLLQLSNPKLGSNTDV